MDKIGSGQRLGQREQQEDAIAVVRPDAADANSDVLLLLADGMGGHAGGEVASALAIDVFSDHFRNVSQNMRPRGRLSESLDAANASIAERIAQEPQLAGMGCTFIGVLVAQERLVWISVGDSVLYLLRGGRLRRLNADHSLMGELSQMVDRGDLTRAEAENHPQRNALRSAVTGGGLSLVDVNSMELEPGDTVLMATDGIETIDTADIAKILQTTVRDGAQSATDRLLDAVEMADQPRQDNTSVIVLRQTGMTSSAGFFPPTRRRAGLRDPRTVGVLAGLAGIVTLGLLAVFLLRDPEETVVPPDPALETSQPGGRAILLEPESGGTVIGDERPVDVPSATPDPSSVPLEQPGPTPRSGGMEIAPDTPPVEPDTIAPQESQPDVAAPGPEPE